MSLNVPVATSCCVVPFARVGAEGVMSSELSVAAVTVTGSVFIAVPIEPVRLAVTVTLPAFTPVTLPATTVATVGSLLDQVTEDVTSFVVLSAAVTIAFTLDDVPAAIDRTGGVKSSEIPAVPPSAPALPPSPLVALPLLSSPQLAPMRTVRQSNANRCIHPRH